MNHSTFLLDGGCRDPDGDQAVLAVREAVARVGGDFQEEVTIVARVSELLLRRAAKRNSAKDQRPRVVSEFLLARVALLADELNSLQVFQRALGDSDRGQRRLKRSEGRTRDSAGRCAPAFGFRAWNVIKP
jgi:hypothetical protein